MRQKTTTQFAPKAFGIAFHGRDVLSRPDKTAPGRQSEFVQAENTDRDGELMADLHG